MNTKDYVQKWLTNLLSDPIALILVNNCSLSSTQLETFVIDILAENYAGKRLTYDQKGRLRLLRTGASRGSFNRTLAQAKKNISKSVYTIILLGYLGVFESPKLDPLLDIANKIETYSKTYRKLWDKGNIGKEHMKMLSIFQREIEEALRTLTKPTNIGKVT